MAANLNETYTKPVTPQGTQGKRAASGWITITDLNDGADAPVPQINPTTNNWELKDLKTGAIKDLGVKAVGVDGKSIKGDPGKDGASSYAYTRYSASSDGSSMTEAPTSASRYVGHYSGPSATCPAYTAFKWAKFYPTIGMKNNHITIEGVETGDSLKGADGTSSYSYVRYSPNADGSSMTVKPSSATKYIGHYSGTASSCPAYTSFTWAKYYPSVSLSFGNKLTVDGVEIGDSLKGADGKNGANGVTPYVVYAYTIGGTFIRNGIGTVKLGARVTRGGSVVEDSSSATKTFTYEWTKYDKDGVAANWAGTSSSIKSGNPVTVAASDISDKTTFRCKVIKP